MKKILLILLAMVMVFSMTACGSKTEDSDQNQDAAATFTDSIPIGDGVADFDITAKCYGEYTAVEGLDEALGGQLEEGETVIEYYCEDCDTPYIDVFSIDKNGKTLEEFTKEQSEMYANGYYCIFDGTGYYTDSWNKDNEFYYISHLVYEGDEQFHTITFSSRTEEVALGDNIYAYIPTGYTAEESDYGPSILMGSYDECYALPCFRFSVNDDSYETTKANFSYNGEFGFTEEQYNEWLNTQPKPNIEKLFEAVGYELVTNFNKESEAGTIKGFIIDNQRDENEAYAGIAYVGDYRLALWCDDGMPAYPYLHVLMDSIHTK